MLFQHFFVPDLTHEMHAFSEMKGPVRDLAERAGWPAKYGRMIGFLSLHQAVSVLHHE